MKEFKLNGMLKLHSIYPLCLIPVLFGTALWLYTADHRAGLIVGGIGIVYAAGAGVLYLLSRKSMMKDVAKLSEQYGHIQNVLLKELAIPYAILTEDGKIIWANNQFYHIFDISKNPDRYMSKYIQELDRNVFPKKVGQTVELEIVHEEKEYMARLSKVCLSGKKENEIEPLVSRQSGNLIAVSLTDVTELKHYIQLYDDQRLAAGLIYIDNYEEVMESVEEVRQSLLVALIDRKINQYMTTYDGIVKKLEKDKYFFVMKSKNFQEMERKKFTILEDAKSVSIGNTMPVTLSMGVGFSQETYAQSYAHARVAIDLALARGGDQAVVKRGNEITYFGGKREQTSKNTRVKARVKAEALREFIMAKDQVIVMGHKIADVDSFGAAIGIFRAATMMQKKAYIVLNEITTSVRPFYNTFCESSAYPEDMFITNADVNEIMTDNTMVVVVDTNKPDMTECQQLLKMAKTIVVFDHHRQGGNMIENTVLSYIEPYASSACEMVAEVLQYIGDGLKVTNLEANIMYAGIMIDTNNFMNRTGVRTFEAAAFLRRCGADIPYVRKLFRNDIESYREKSEIVGKAEIFKNEYAIACYENSDVESPTIIGAQAANELLNVDRIKASFVLTKYNGKIYVSARSIDEVNVQKVMEKMGGGGHINTAGAQFQHTNMDEAVAALKHVLDTMIEEGDI